MQNLAPAFAFPYRPEHLAPESLVSGLNCTAGNGLNLNKFKMQMYLQSTKCTNIIDQFHSVQFITDTELCTQFCQYVSFNTGGRCTLLDLANI